MTDREAFEKWIVEENPDRAINKYDNGAYADWDTDKDWDAWQAACKYKDELKPISLTPNTPWLDRYT